MFAQNQSRSKVILGFVGLIIVAKIISYVVGGIIGLNKAPPVDIQPVLRDAAASNDVVDGVQTVPAPQAAVDQTDSRSTDLVPAVGKGVNGTERLPDLEPTLAEPYINIIRREDLAPTLVEPHMEVVDHENLAPTLDEPYMDVVRREDLAPTLIRVDP